MRKVLEPFVRDIRERLEEARVLMNDPASRPRAVQVLESIVSDASETSYAAEAMALLQRHDVIARLPERRDPETESLREEWLQIHRAWDGRLPSFLDRLRQRPVQLADLLPAVVPDIREWLAQGAEEIRRSLRDEEESPDRKQLDAIQALADQVAAIPRLEAELREDLGSFRDASFGLLLSRIAAEVRRCCGEWEIERAWELMEQLGDRPAAYEQEVRSLEATIGAADKLRAAVESTLSHWPDLFPEQWGELQVLLEAIAEARRHLSELRVPESSQQELRHRVDQALGAALQFLRRRASEAASLDDLRDGWRWYQHSRSWETDPLLEAQPEWFARALTRIEGRLEDEVVAAESSAQLASIGRRLGADLADLPPDVKGRLAACADQMAKLAAEWQRMSGGEEFLAPDGLMLTDPAMVPVAFASAVPHFRSLLERARHGLEALRQPGAHADRERACEEAYQEALMVLEEAPIHAAGRRLRSLADAQKLQLSLDQALSCWDVEGFLSLARQATLEPPYQELAGRSSVLRAMADLALQAELATTTEAATWWRRWQGEVQRLPAGLPESLDRAREAESARRCSQWSLALDRLLAKRLPPDEWRLAAASLAEVVGETGLESYYRETLRREAVGRIEDLLAKGDWLLAEARLAELTDRDPDIRRLSTCLAVERARSTGGAELSEELARSWADVLSVYGEEAYRLLDSALGESWTRGDAEALRRLTEVARRVLRSPSTPQAVRDPIRDWLDWLQIQIALEETVSASGLRQLAAYALADPKPSSWRRRLTALIDGWRERDQLVALAWAYQAFPGLFDAGATDPVEALAERSEQLAQHVDLQLQAWEELRPEEQAHLGREVEERERDWRDLDVFLNLLSRPILRQPSEAFRQNRDRIRSLLRVIADLDDLESCDLRQEAARSKWNAAWQALSQDLGDLPVAAALRSRLERLHGLTRLASFESQLRDTAGKCGGRDPQELDRPGLFAEAARCIAPIVGRLHAAGQVGGEMWRALSREYWQEIPDLAGDLLALPEARDLNTLMERFEELEAGEQLFRQALQDLSRNEPWVSAGGGFLPESHRPYLGLYPRTAPSSRRVLRLFDRFARIAPRPDILRASAAFLPAWISEYLKGGVP